jgi:hypothetical protein
MAACALIGLTVCTLSSALIAHWPALLDSCHGQNVNKLLLIGIGKNRKEKRERVPILLKMPPVGYSINMEVLSTLVEQSGVQRETNSRTKKAI